jgi:DMSO/TMAO reductase YedYZ heme-binding membrane subunit
MWVIATTDLFLAILSTANRIPGGLITRFAGHGFLFFGTISTVMLLPLAITANQRAQRWLGRHWKTLHKLVYVIWVTILIHLFLLFGFNSIAVEALVISLPLVYFRIPFIRDWWNTARRTHTDLLTRVVCGAILGFLFMLPMVQFMRELLNTGVGAFVGHPPG